MKTTINLRQYKQNTWFKIGIAAVLFVVLSTLNGRAEATSIPIRARSSAASAADMLDGIVLGSGVTDADAAFLQENLDTLFVQLPVWWVYIQDAKPFTLAVDVSAGAQGRAAYTRCCQEGMAVITFGFHFDQLALTTDAANSSMSSRRMAFLAFFVHEVTHVRDQKAGQFSGRTDYNTCVAAERSALTVQLQFERDFMQMLQSDSMLGVQDFSMGFQDVISDETKALGSRETWYAYCGDLLD